MRREIGVLAAPAAAIMPIVAGATEAARTGQIGSGARVGFWSGAVSGVITFVALASVGYLVVSVPGFPGVEFPHNAGRAFTANDLAAFNVGDYLAGGVSHLVVIGAPSAVRLEPSEVYWWGRFEVNSYAPPLG